MTDKNLLINNIKEWVTVNKTITDMQRQIREHRKRRQELSDILFKIMESNDIECFDINNGKLVCRKNRVKATINSKLLSQTLSQYFKDKDDIDVSDVVSYINENRPINEKPVILIKEKK